jgi:hypothetical protein
LALSAAPLAARNVFERFQARFRLFSAPVCNDLSGFIEPAKETAAGPSAARRNCAESLALHDGFETAMPAVMEAMEFVETEIRGSRCRSRRNEDRL